MKIGIITFHASHNYGSMLQAWALQTYLAKQGHEVEIINYRSFFQKRMYFKAFEWGNKNAWKSSLKRLFLYPSSFRSLNKKWHLFEDFLHKELYLTPEFNTVEQLYQAKLDYDVVIVGSDQIWNTDTKECTEAYFAKFVNCPKISYAASFGPDVSHIKVDFIRKHLKGFQALSVREEAGKQFLIKNGLADKTEIVCDPTLLLESQDYNALIDEKPLIEEDYIFFYTPHAVPRAYFPIANKIGEQLGLPVLTDRAYYPNDIKQYKHIRNYPEVGPKEFLNLIKNAKLILGGSFHMLVFSLLFHKNFYSINADKDARTNHLITELKLNERIISLNDGIINDEGNVVFSSDKETILLKMKSLSKCFLQNNIEKITNKINNG